ncbi:hypothetical protein [Geoglobus sp.]
MSTEEVEVECPVCKKTHRLEKRVDVFYCRKATLVLLNDRHGWRLMEVKEISERQDRELDRLWGSDDEG